MANTKLSTSLIGMYVASEVKVFLNTGVKLLTADPDTSEEDGNDLLANAIGYGIAKALTMPAFAALMDTSVIAVAPTTPIGTEINSVYTAMATET